MKTITHGVAAVVGISALALSLAAFGQTDAMTVQIGDFSLSLATAQPLDPSAVPEYGTFYLLSDYVESDGSPPPYPFISILIRKRLFTSWAKTTFSWKTIPQQISRLRE